MAAAATIKWSDIEVECGSFRDGFVAVFHKYEGQSTDEVNSRGSVVKVTQASFSEHFGIHKATFGRWVKAAKSINMIPLTTTTQQPTPQQATTRNPPGTVANLAKQLAALSPPRPLPTLLDDLEEVRDTLDYCFPEKWEQEGDGAVPADLLKVVDGIMEATNRVRDLILGLITVADFPALVD